MESPWNTVVLHLTLWKINGIPWTFHIVPWSFFFFFFYMEVHGIKIFLKITSLNNRINLNIKFLSKIFIKIKKLIL
jgi:hypothetical protein